jgi:mRNA interferase RelE/StbE
LVDEQAYEVFFKPSVEKDLRRLPAPMLQRLLDRISALSGDPRPRGVMKLTGAERLYRVRLGDYRIVYEIDDAARRVTVHYVRHRSDAYRSL